MKVKAPLVVGVLVGVLILSVGLAKVSGYWRTESSKVPAVIETGEFAGEFDPSDIRGSYSFADIEAAFGVPPEILAAAFSMSGSDPSVILAKDLETTWEGLEDVEVGTDSIRMFTAYWTGRPHEGEEDTVLPLAAVQILESYGKIDAAAAAGLAARAVVPPFAAGGEEPPSTPPKPAEGEERTVKGLSTFGDLIGWGVDEAAWEAAAGAPMGSRSTDLRTWAEAEGRSMSEIRALAQNLVDEAE